MADVDNMQAVIDAARHGMQPHKMEVVGTKSHYFVPTGGSVIHLDLEAGMPTPARKRGAVTVFDHASFSKLMAQNSDEVDATVYVDRSADNPAIVAVLNGNGINGPGWGDFRLHFGFRKTPQ